MVNLFDNNDFLDGDNNKQDLSTIEYDYPSNFSEIKPKLEKLKAATMSLESNLLDVALVKNTQTEKPLAIDYHGELNPSQLLAATTISGKVLVIAGAGSGKTKTLTYRTSYLIEQGVSAEHILIVTFTRKAAHEIKQRAHALLANSLGEQVSLSQITSGTFHSFCNRLLRQYSGLLGISANFTILDTGDSADAIDLIKKELMLSKDKAAGKGIRKSDAKRLPRKATLQKMFSTARNKRIHIDELIEKDYPDFIDETDDIITIAKAYHRYKRQNHLYDFDDIIDQVVRHLKSNDKFRALLQSKYRYIMVDEYQDTNIPQKQLIDLISQPKDISLMVVGDDNQSIYGFRGANYENILRFGESYPDAKLIKLEQNYRSTPRILGFVNELSDQITLGYQKRLYSQAPVQGDAVIFKRASSETTEATFIADTILAKASQHGFSEFAVLCRTSFQANYVQLAFTQRNIPFVVVGGIKFAERRHIKDILAFVKVMWNPSDAIAWHRILTLYKGIGDVTATKITAAIAANTNSQTKENTFEPLVSAHFLKKNEDLQKLHDLLTDIAQTQSVARIIDKITDFYTPLLKLIEDNWRERSEDFRVLKTLAIEQASVDEFLNNLALDPPNDSVAASADPEVTKEVVTISTIHSAKGLEWPVVFVISLVDGLMPHHRSFEDFEQLEEERKLFYVACSRAKTELYLTAPNYYTSFSSFFDKPSRFISELDEASYVIDYEQDGGSDDGGWF